MDQIVNFIAEDYLCSGYPTLPARIGVNALDIQTGDLYTQKRQPWGSEYQKSKFKFYYPLAAATGGGGSPTGPAGGDLAGNYPNPSVVNDSHNHTPGVSIPAYPTELAPTGPAGGDLAGNYPNPTVVNDSHDHTPGVSIPAYPTALPPSGPAGGDLQGTYPNPTINPALVSTPNLIAAISVCI